MPHRPSPWIRALPLGAALIASPAFALGDSVLWYTGNSGYTTTGYAAMEATLTTAGADSFDVTTTWPGDLSAYRLVFLVKSAHLYTASAVTNMKDFVDAGGTLVLLQDSAGGDAGSITVFNNLAEDLGLTTSFAYDELDDSCDSVGSVVGTSSLVTCVDSIVYSKSSDISVGSGGEALIAGESDQNLVAAEGSVVFISDLAIVFDTCTLETGNLNLIRNLYKGVSGTSEDDDCDGYDAESAGGTDCDDANDTIYPGADDICDDLDNDCDGTADNDLSYGSTYYPDKDEDAYGVDGTTIVACGAPTGYADNRQDCNDYDDTVYPTAPELCDEQDNDCDGTTDEDPSDGITWYADQDADGYGGTDYTEVACDKPDNFIADGTDCDDTKVQVHPGATEYCNDLDDDCNDEVDDNPANAITFYADSDGDGYGDAATTTAACDTPTGYVSSGDDCDDADATSYPGADGWSADCEQLGGGDGGDDTGTGKTTGCSCATPEGAAPNLGAWALLGLAALVRRRKG